MSQSAPKGLWPAVTAIERVGFLRLRLYEHYDRDADLRDRLMQLQPAWWGWHGRSLARLSDCLLDLDDAEQLLAGRVGVNDARDYLAAIRALAAEVGLDRIPMVGTPPEILTGYLPSGVAQVHRYLWHLYNRLPREGAPPDANERFLRIPRPSFVALASFGAPIPVVDMSIAGTSARWDPRTELRVDARPRLRKETGLASEAIEAELTRIADQGGYEFPDTATQRSGIWRLDRDAQWVWWRIRRRWTYEQIAREWQRLHSDDFRMQYRLADKVSRRWKAEHPQEAGTLLATREAVGMVRKAVTTFARRAQVNVVTGPGRQASRTQ
jgi:hypothetical protein